MIKKNRGDSVRENSRPILPRLSLAIHRSTCFLISCTSKFSNGSTLIYFLTVICIIDATCKESTIIHKFCLPEGLIFSSAKGHLIDMMRGVYGPRGFRMLGIMKPGARLVGSAYVPTYCNYSRVWYVDSAWLQFISVSLFARIAQFECPYYYASSSFYISSKLTIPTTRWPKCQAEPQPQRQVLSQDLSWMWKAGILSWYSQLA